METIIRPDQRNATTNGRENRSFPRYALRLDASLQWASGNSAACEIRNFCIGGMFVVYKLPADQAILDSTAFPGVGETVTICCTVPSADNGAELTFDARIRRTDLRSSGLAFVNPDLAALGVIQNFASQFQALESNDQALRQTEPDVAGEVRVTTESAVLAITQACKLAVLETAEPMLDSTLTRIATQLYEKSGEAADFQTQNQYYTAYNAAKNSKDTLINAILGAINERLCNIKPPFNTSQAAAGAPDPELTLIEDDVLEDWLAASDAANVVETKYSQPLSLLEEGLSILFSERVNADTNPYGPQLFLDAFHDTIKDLEFDPLANKICYTCFKEVLVEKSGPLYEQLNTVLSENGISPLSEDRAKPQHRASAAQQDPHCAAQDDQPPENAFKKSTAEESEAIIDEPIPPSTTRDNSDDAPASSAPLTPTDVADKDSPEQTQTAAMSRPVAHQENGDATAERSDNVRENSGPQATVATNSASASDEADLFKVVRELLDLRKVLKQQTFDPDSGPLPTQLGSQQRIAAEDAITRTSLSPTDHVYETNEVVSAISSLQSKYDTSEVADSVLQNVRAHIQDQLATATPDDVAKQISVHDTDVMDVSDGLFNAMLEDPLVADSVKPWIKRLKLPIVKVALEDNSLFLDKTHVIRDVINRISQLEFYREDETSSRQDGLKNIMDGLIDKANKEFDGTNQVFHNMLKQLDRLSKIQNQSYTENLKDVRKACAQEKPAPATEEYTDAQRERLADDEWEMWLKRARRISEGDWVHFKLDDTKSKKLRVAWIDPDKEVFVFVNYLGLKNKTLGIQDLALNLYHGRVVPLDSVDDPAMDRAQLSMLQSLHEQLLHETTHDQLTGLVNRREFERLLSDAVASTKHDGSRHALCFIDVDNFSVVNNSCGYAGGDKLLTELASKMQQTLGEQGVLARLGSDEFGMLLENCILDEALDIAEQQIKAIADFRFEWEETSFSIALSIGLVPINSQSGTTTELLQAAESSNAIAKDAGGNRLQVYHAGHARVSHRNEMMKWVGIIDKTLETDSLELRCQRIEPINSEAGALPHYETLLSVLDDNNRPVAPERFIQAAEWYGRMPSVDRWVVRHVFQWLANHQKAFVNTAGVTINLSGQSLADDTFLAFLFDEMKKTQVPREKICFEITETVGISNLSDAAEFIQHIKTTGCKFALDDFGSGMSSYGYLKNLPVDYLKIDGTFIKNIEIVPSDYAVVKSVCEVAHFMDKKVVAEYVESENTLNLLRDIGVDYAQGYFIEKPISLDDMFKTIKEK